MREQHTPFVGWMAFIRDNGINLGDTCIFELVSNFVMQIYIFGVENEGLDDQNGNVKLNSWLHLPANIHV